MKTTIVYDSQERISENNIYAIIVTEHEVDVQKAIDEAKAEAIEEYGDSSWCVDDVLARLKIDSYFEVLYCGEFAEI